MIEIKDAVPGYMPARELIPGEFCNPTVEAAYKAAAAQDRKAFAGLINQHAREMLDEFLDELDEPEIEP